MTSEIGLGKGSLGHSDSSASGLPTENVAGLQREGGTSFFSSRQCSGRKHNQQEILESLNLDGKDLTEWSNDSTQKPLLTRFGRKEAKMTLECLSPLPLCILGK